MPAGPGSCLVSYKEEILRKALEEIKALSATTLLDSGDTKINQIATDALRDYEREKERIANIPPY